MRRRRGIMGLNGGAGIPVITATATGNPLTFETNLARPLKSLVIPFTPIQAGSGDPSPTNVRPISGWAGANVYNEETYDASATPKLTINWQSEAGTVYGGTVTLNEDGSADVTAKWFYGTPNYSALGYTSYSDGGYRNAYNYYGSGSLINFPEAANHTQIISDKAVRGSFSTTNTNPVVMVTSGNYIYFGVKSELLESDNRDGLRAYLVEHAPAICYPLKQQDYIVYHFDSIGQLITFVGTNNIWTDTNGTNTATYLKHQS